ncbi:MAG: ABC transporter permease [Gammaproteobacteria bacterium]|nr:ABC transporter permease [Gammaproteobacteria bacterium]
MMRTRENKLRKILFKSVFILAMALLLALLGTFDRIGYHVHEIEELSFTPDYRYNYADATFKFNATYNPILYPFYWILGKGHISGDFSMIYLPESYERSEWGPAVFGSSPEDHFGKYISFMLTWGIFGNFGFLLLMTIVIEALKRRVLYASLFSGVFGFSIAGISGMMVGLFVGGIAAVLVLRQGYTFSITGLKGYIIKRIAYSFVLVLAVITINFILFMRMPGNPVSLFSDPIKGWRLTENQTAAFEQEARRLWGFNQPTIPQYFTYVRNLLFFNLGYIGTTQTVDMKITPIAQNLAERLPYTIFLLGTATAISLVIGVMLGTKAIQKRGGAFDKLSSIIPITISSMPVWWIGFLLLTFFGGALKVTYYEGGVPIGGGHPLEWAYNPPIPYGISTSFSDTALQIGFSLDFQEILRLIGGYLQYALLPLCALVLSMFGQWVLLTRASMLETVSEDYVLTARAKGLTEWKILTKHGIKNACLPLITQAAISFGFIISGSIFVESVFRYPGIGTWLFDAIRFNDFPILMTVFYIVALFVIIANIIADLLYGLIDPRIKTAN